MVDMFEGGGSFPRSDRVASSLMKELSEILQRDVKDPRLAGCTVMRVRLSRDLKVAWVYLSVFPKENWKAAEKALKKASGFIRREAGRRLRLRRSPELRFQRDEGVDNMLEMDKILKGLDTGSDEEE